MHLYLPQSHVLDMAENGELSASEDEVDGVPLIPSAYVPQRGGQADAHAIFKSPESSLA